MLIGLNDKVLLEQAYANVLYKVKHKKLWFENYGTVLILAFLIY